MDFVLPTLLQAVSLTKSFSGVHALRNGCFELRPGEVHALVGENGAGKSTLIKIFTGALQPDSGTFLVGGAAVEKNTPAHARSLGIAAIYQQPSLFPDLTVGENIGVALESGSLWRKVNWPERNEKARQLLARAGSAIDPERLVRTLSMPEQQIVEIAKAIGARARIVIMDEPTASLTDREVEHLFDVVKRLRTEGTGVIYISHRLEEISAIADRVTVLRDGETIATRSMGDVSRNELIKLMVGRELSAVFPKREVEAGEPILDVRELGSREADLHNISFSVRRGEILGFAGLVGSGRTELARVLFGLVPMGSGKILLRGTPFAPASPSDAIRRGMAYVPEDRRQHGVVLPMTVSANTSLASLGSVSRNGLIDDAVEQKLARSYVDRLRIKTSSVYSEVSMLSGGNQQKVALARWLATKPDVVILDEPTQGVDVGSKSEIHSLMVELAEQGCAILMISSELPEILGMSDRIAVMHEGTVAGVLMRAEATPQKILTLALGHAFSDYSAATEKEHLS